MIWLSTIQSMNKYTWTRSRNDNIWWTVSRMTNSLVRSYVTKCTFIIILSSSSSTEMIIITTSCSVLATTHMTLCPTFTDRLKHESIDVDYSCLGLVTWHQCSTSTTDHATWLITRLYWWHATDSTHQPICILLYITWTVDGGAVGCTWRQTIELLTIELLAVTSSPTGLCHN